MDSERRITDVVSVDARLPSGGGRGTGVPGGTCGAPEGETPSLPRYGEASLDTLIPSLFGAGLPGTGVAAFPAARTLVPAPDRGVVVFVVDGLGLLQFETRRDVAPVLAGLALLPFTSVVPSTTAAGLPSITTGVPPGHHGLTGPVIRLADSGSGGAYAFDVLEWTAQGGADASGVRAEAELVQPVAPFCGRRVLVITKAKHRDTGFTRAHLRGASMRYWRSLSSIRVEIRRAVRDGETFIYAYYDGLDTIGHHHGLGEHYEAELASIDRTVGDVLADLPKGWAVVVVGDHGLVTVDRMISIDRDVAGLCQFSVGEERFLWLVAKPGSTDRLLDELTSRYAPLAWVRHRDDVVGSGWLGPAPQPFAVSRLGDVCVVPRGPFGFTLRGDIDGRPPRRCLHGGLSADEMFVPVLVHQTQ